ncbi:HK97 gp10 family phage protein [Pediococcus acidilactici]|uniref:HK97 gp10 family phage protein n=1 Tax=Pediococcus acidilactici TaxID=1254 RepID=UPI000A81FDC0|nr:HK97 gp10 family phage protein [Pediococcus acidilactici]
MSNYNFSIKGQDLLIRKLKHKAQKGAVKAIVKSHTANMESKAQELAPVDTGNLKRGISSQLLKGGMAGALFLLRNTRGTKNLVLVLWLLNHTWVRLGERNDHYF